MADRSRLNRRLVRQSEKNLVLSVVGIIAILFLLFKFGIPFISNLSLMLSSNKTSGTEEKKSSQFIPPPMLDTTFSATNSAQVTITGTANKDYKVKLFVNDSGFDTTDVNNDNTFKFENVKLTEGNNTIQAKAISKDKEESKYSESITIVYRQKEPSLTVDSPSDNAHYGKDDQTARVSGQTDPGVRVTVNDLWAIVDAQGKFSYDLPLKGGDQEVKIVATDDAGNSKTVTRKVSHDQ